MCIHYSLTITSTKKWAQIHLVFLWEIRSAFTHYSVLRFIKLNFIELGNIRLLHKHAASPKYYMSTQYYQYCKFKPNKVNRQVSLQTLNLTYNEFAFYKSIEINHWISFLGVQGLNPVASKNTVRLLTHVLCKPTHVFFHSFIGTMSDSLQTSFNSVMKDWADIYHV